MDEFKDKDKFIRLVQLHRLIHIFEEAQKNHEKNSGKTREVLGMADSVGIILKGKDNKIKQIKRG